MDRETAYNAQSRLPQLIGVSVTLATLVLSIHGTAPLRADTAGGEASAFLGQSDANTCAVWSPLFRHGFDGWRSTLALHSRTEAPSTAEVRVRPFGGAEIVRPIDIPARGTRLLTGSELGLSEGFDGSITAEGKPCGQLSAVTYHDAAGWNRMALESPERAGSSVFIPLVFNDYNDWKSTVVIQNTDTVMPAVARVQYRQAGQPPTSQEARMPAGGSTRLDLSFAPKGALTVQVDASSDARLVAAAYHVGRAGIADASNGSSAGAQRSFLPLLFRNSGFENGYNSGVRVVNVSAGVVRPRITFYDAATGESVGSLASERDIQAGEDNTWYLPNIGILQDGRNYAAQVEHDGGAALLVLANHVNYGRGTAMIYSGATHGSANVALPVLARRADLRDSGIQVQNLADSSVSVAVRFRDTTGTARMVTPSEEVRPKGSVTVYLPALDGLPDGFIGSAEVMATGEVAAIANTVRYLDRQQGEEEVLADLARDLTQSGNFPATLQSVDCSARVTLTNEREVEDLLIAATWVPRGRDGLVEAIAPVLELRGRGIISEDQYAVFQREIRDLVSVGDTVCDMYWITSIPTAYRASGGFLASQVAQSSVMTRAVAGKFEPFLSLSGIRPLTPRGQVSPGIPTATPTPPVGPTSVVTRSPTLTLTPAPGCTPVPQVVVAVFPFTCTVTSTPTRSPTPITPTRTPTPPLVIPRPITIVPAITIVPIPPIGEQPVDNPIGAMLSASEMAFTANKASVRADVITMNHSSRRISFLDRPGYIVDLSYTIETSFDGSQIVDHHAGASTRLVGVPRWSAKAELPQTFPLMMSGRCGTARFTVQWATGFMFEINIGDAIKFDGPWGMSGSDDVRLINCINQNDSSVEPKT